MGCFVWEDDRLPQKRRIAGKKKKKKSKKAIGKQK
jgi:hypothetical protein